MADEKITTSLSVDVTDLKKGLSDANRAVRLAASEFDEATAGMDKWSTTSEGLKAKLTQLNKTLDGQKAALNVLEAEYARVASEQGESSKSAQELQIKINKQQAAIKKTEASIDKYGNALDDMDKETDEATASTGKMSVSFGKAATAAGKLARSMAGIAGKAVTTGLKGIATASAGLVTAFLATAETSKEWATEMGKLDAAFTSSGHSAETAGKTFDELYSIIGETDQAVEAAQQIALLTKSEKDAAKWAELGAGVVGKFGDALQPETFFEAANETLKLNQATGAYTQMLEGCGYNVEEFNAGLQACKTEQEKQAYMLKVTEGLLGSAGEAYRENNAAIIENNKANAKMQEVLAKVGQAATPVMTALKLMGASILSDLLPHVETLGTSFKEALSGNADAAAKMGGAVSAILKQLGEKIVAALPTIITVGTSIITSLVQGIIDAAPALAAGVGQIMQYFVNAAPQLLSAGATLISQLVQGVKNALPSLLQTGGQMIGQLLQGIANNLPNMAQGALDAIGGFVNALQTYVPVVLEKGREILTNLVSGISAALPSLIDQALDILMNFATTLYNAAPTLIDTGFDLLSKLVKGIFDALPTLLSKAPEIISKFANIINDNFPRILKKGVELIGQIIKGIIKAIPQLIKNAPKIIKAIVDVWSAFNWVNLGKNAMTGLKNGIDKMLGAVKNAGKSIADGVTNMLKNLPSKLLSMGKSAVTSLGNALRSGIATARSAATSIGNSIIEAVKSIPSRIVSVGSDIVRGLWNGISSMGGWIAKKISGWASSLVDNAKEALGIGSPSKVMAAEVGRWLPAGLAVGVEKNTAVAAKSMAQMAKDAVAAANAEFNGATMTARVTGSTAAGAGKAVKAGNVYNYNQYNYSPKPLNRAEIYRQTKNQLRFATQN